ncbi:MAG: MoaD/ThiS family protein [Candidatus Bathyarchaeia archaeon]
MLKGKVEVTVRLVGVFRVLSGKSQVTVGLAERATVGDIVQKLVVSFPAEFGSALVDPVLGEPQPNALILVNGKEIGVLDGVETVVGHGDEVVFVPVAHGG